MVAGLSSGTCGTGIIFALAMYRTPTPAKIIAKIHSGFFFVNKHIDAVAMETEKSEMAIPILAPALLA